MWLLSFTIYFGLKWLAWWRARSKLVHPPWRSLAFILAWPGMNAAAFLDTSRRVPSPMRSRWFSAMLETSAGFTLLWIAPRSIPERDPLIRGWVGMFGLILILHFGLFQVIALLWQELGVAADPIMRAPLRSTSLGEFWGQRWNLGFRQLAHELIFLPSSRVLGTGLAGFLVFMISGLIHDLVISVPARGGYGLPSLYFLLQGLGVTIERSQFGKSFGLARGGLGWSFMMLFLVGPLFWLFHPWFVMRVILPFMKVIHAL